MEGLVGYATDSSSSNSSSSSSSSDDDANTSQVGPVKKRPRVAGELSAQELRRSTVSDAFLARDDPSQNDGRRRQFGHEPGNWASFVCIPVEPHQDLERWVSTIIECADAHCARQSAGGAAPPKWRRIAEHGGDASTPTRTGGYLHISLSRTFPLRFPDIVPFRETLDIGVNAYARSTAGHGCFTMALQRLKLFTNEDRSRSFISLCAAETRSGSDQQAKLVRLIHEVVDPACISVGAPRFYDPAEPHLSIVWTLGDLTPLVDIKQLQAEVESSLSQAGSSTQTETRPVDGVNVHVDRIQTTSGNMLKSYVLRDLHHHQ